MTSVWARAWIVSSCIVSAAAAQDIGAAAPLEFRGAMTQPGMEPADDVVPDALIVQFRPDAAVLAAAAEGQAAPWTGVASLDDLAAAFGVTSIRREFPGATPEQAAQAGLPDLSGYFVVQFDTTVATLDDIVAAYAADANVLHAERIGIHPIYATPNDGNYASQWHLNQANDKDMDAPEAWNIETGDSAIIAAMLDTGVRYYHKDLGGSAASASNPTAADGNVWINTAEKNGVAGVDDDGNGYVDDWVGWDFVTGISGCSSGEDCSGADNDPRDFNGHGTHCAGNITAINNNGYATASPSGGWGNGTLQPTANGVKVMAMRIGWDTPTGGYVRMDFAASALYYAANKGARIASCSWGASNSGGIGAAVDYFVAAGGLVIKAAGNSNSQTADYLCSRSDVYCVAATDQNDVKASFSNYGTWVDISGPGVSILSLYHNKADPTPDYVASISGTSMATPLVAGAAAAVWSQNPGWTRLQVWAQVRDTADNIDAQNPSYVGRLGSGRVNLFNAVNTSPGCQTNADCDDGNPCNGAEVCVAGVCQPGSIVDCNGNGTDDACDISGGASQDCNGNGTPDECEVDPCPTSGAVLLIGFTGSTSVPGVGTVQNEDLVTYDTGTGQWALYFDGSDVGLSSFAIDAVAVLPGGDLLISVDVDGSLTGLQGGPSGTSVDDSDLVRFTPTSLGANTAGTWTFYFDGSDVGLTQSTEDVDAVTLTASGQIVISATGSPGVSGLSGLQDEDLIVFTPTSLGATTAGSWGYYFDGSDVGLSSNSGEDVDAAGWSAEGALLLSTLDAFSVPGASGADEDLAAFTPTSLGSATAGSYTLYLDGSAVGIPTASDIGAMEVLP